MTIVERLRLEHRLIRSLLDLIEEAVCKDADAVGALPGAMAGLMALLEAHERLEESVLYPAAAGAVETAPLEEAHRMLDRSLAVYRDSMAGKQPWTAAAAVEQLIVLVREHMREEEDVLFPRIEKELDRQSLEALGEREA